MTVKELIEKLSKIENKDSPVYFIRDDSDGCGTCGYGCNQIEHDIFLVDDIGGKVWLQA